MLFYMIGGCIIRGRFVLNIITTCRNTVLKSRFRSIIKSDANEVCHLMMSFMTVYFVKHHLKGSVGFGVLCHFFVLFYCSFVRPV